MTAVGSDAGAKPKALYLVYQRTVFADAFRTASRLRAEGRYEPVFLIPSGSEALLPREIEKAQRAGIACVLQRDLEARARVKFREPPKLPRKISWLERVALRPLRTLMPPRPQLQVLSSRPNAPARPAIIERSSRGRRYLRSRGRLPLSLRDLLRPIVDEVWRMRAQHPGLHLRANIAAAAYIVPRLPLWILYFVAWFAFRVARSLQYRFFYQCRRLWSLRRVARSRRLASYIGRPIARLGRAADAAAWKVASRFVGDEQIIAFFSWRLRLRRRTARRLRRLGLLSGGRVWTRLRRQEWYGTYRHLIAAELAYRKVLIAVAPDVLLLPEDVPGSLTAPLIRAAHKRGIPSVIVPFTIPNPLEAAEACLATPAHHLHEPADFATAVAYPNWMLHHKGKFLLRASRILVTASEKARLAPPLPWVINSGKADRIAVECDKTLEVYRRLGFPERQTVLTGAAADDLLFDYWVHRAERREALYAELGLPAGRPMLLSALVPDQFGVVPQCEFPDYDSLVAFWVAALGKWRDRFNVIVKINPRLYREDFLHLEELGVTIAPQDTMELVPLADIYVASISSTLRWAAACGIPAINYDVYYYRYGDYLTAPGIVHVETQQDYIVALDRLAGDDAFRESLRRRQTRDACHWGRLDGRATERLADLMDELCQESTVPRASGRELARRSVPAVNCQLEAPRLAGLTAGNTDAPGSRPVRR